MTSDQPPLPGGFLMLRGIRTRSFSRKGGSRGRR
jgi:hypothetical protein